VLEVSLKELIESGHFGPLRLGMSREQVEGLLGAPDDLSVGSRKYSQACILKYGDVEFHFDPRGGGLWLIHLEQLDSPSAGKAVNLDPWVIQSSLTLPEMERCLSLSGITYQVTEHADWEDYKCMVAGAGAKLIFDGDEDRLRSLSHSRISAAADESEYIL
jgi:hypothetical protein